MNKQHHILTTGISLLTNFERLNKMQRGEAIKHHSRLKDYLQAQPAEASAEINSLNARTNFLTSPGIAVTLVYTATEEGKCVASLLEAFLKQKQVAIHKIEVRGIDKPAGDATPEWAQQNVSEALTNLQNSVEEHVRKLREQSRHIEFNCTGGYKAEAAVFYALGKKLNIPVYYRHETYKTCITLP